MLAIVSSNVVVAGVVAGIPALAVLLVVLWAAPRRRAVVAAVTLVAVGLAAIAVWAVFRPSGTQPALASLPGVSAPPPVVSAPPPPSPPGGGQSCSPSGTDVHETAKATAFQSTCLAAPAGKPFTITFDNEDAGIPHNMHILASDPASNPGAATLFAGALVTGPKTETYQVNALPAGTYFFQCDVHPTLMRGTFVVA